MKKILPVKQPQITSFVVYANLLSILENYDKTRDWIYSHFINLWGHMELDTIPMLRFSSWYMEQNCPHISNIKMEENLYKGLSKDILWFIKSSLEQDTYLMLFYDKYYIPHSNSYNKKHHTHQIFIYGYDDEKQEFYISDFFYNYKHSYQTVTYSQLDNALKSGKNYKDNCFAIFYRYYDKSYDIDINIIKNSIKNFLNSTNFLLQHEPNYMKPEESDIIKTKDQVFGLSVFDFLIDNVLDIAEKEDRYRDVRPFHVLYDHSVIIKNSVNYWIEKQLIPFNEHLHNLLEKTIYLSLSTRNLFLKYQIKKDNSMLPKIIDNINEIKIFKKLSFEIMLSLL